MKKYETLLIEESENGIVIIKLNRPDSLNAISAQMMMDLRDFLEELKKSIKHRVVVLIGEGRAFSAGWDMKEAAYGFTKEIPEELQKIDYMKTEDIADRSILFQDIISDIMIGFREIPQPVIAAVKGVAYGAGLGLALTADIRVAGKSSKFSAAFIKIGVSGADCGSSYWLPRLIGFSRAAEMCYTGKIVSAEEADKIGLVSRVVPDEEILDEALKIARDMVDKNFSGLRLTKDAFNINLDANSLKSAVRLENRIQCSLFPRSLEEMQAKLQWANKKKI